MSNDKPTTIEQKIAELEKLVTWFDSDDFVLEQAIEHYEHAKKLADEVQQDVLQLKNTITRVDDGKS